MIIYLYIFNFANIYNYVSILFQSSGVCRARALPPEQPFRNVPGVAASFDGLEGGCDGSAADDGISKNVYGPGVEVSAHAPGVDRGQQSNNSRIYIYLFVYMYIYIYSFILYIFIYIHINLL